MSFRKKIDMILEAKQLERLTINKIERSIEKDGTIYKAYKDDREPADLEIVRKLIGTLNIRQEWWDKEWESGSKDIFNTPVQKEAAVTEKDVREKSVRDYARDIIDVIEGKTEYVVIPRSVLKENYRIVPLEQFEKDKLQMERDARELDERSRQIQRLTDLIGQFSERPINIHLPNVELTKKNTGVGNS